MAGSSPAYEAAGVNVEAGDQASRSAYEISQGTWANRDGQFGQPETLGSHFRGVRVIDLSVLAELQREYPDFHPVEYRNSDGTGNKGKVSQRMKIHDTIGIDLAAMVLDDATAAGAEVTGVNNTVIVNTLGKSTDHPNKIERLTNWYADLIGGIAKGVSEGGAVIENGETAEHGEGVDGYGEFRYELVATANWIADKNRLLTTDKIKKGAAIVALADESQGCNGYTLLLDQLEQMYGHEWHHHSFGDGESTWGHELVRPSKVYSALFTVLTGGYHPESDPGADTQALVHVTGGGIFGKLGSKLEGSGLGAVLYGLFDPSPAMLEFQRQTGISDEEMYHVFHMGQRGLVVTSEPETVINLATEKGIVAKIAGEIIGDNVIHIDSRAKDKTMLTHRLAS